VSDAQVSGNIKFAPVRFEFTDEHFKQARFAGTVGTDQPGLLPGGQFHRNVFEQQFRSAAKRYIGQ
jgi:hypothetical protein